MDERIPAIKVLLLPKDTNAYGTIFGGVILSNIDLASAIEARKVAAHRFVTKAMREVEFHEPVFLGDIVSFYTETVRIDRPPANHQPPTTNQQWGGSAHAARHRPFPSSTRCLPARPPTAACICPSVSIRCRRARWSRCAARTSSRSGPGSGRIC